MPRLSVVAVRNARHDPAKGDRAIRIGDGGGLYLQIKPAGTKSWLFRYTLGGRAREMGLGPVATTPAEERAGGVTLAAARDLARDAKALLRQGKDPIAEREAARSAQAAQARARSARTFEAAARALAESKRPGWRNAKHAAQWITTLEQHAFPEIGGKPVAAVGTEDVLAVLRPIWQRIPETAARVRQRIEATLDFARAQGWRPEALANPARWRGHLAAALPPPRKVRAVRHHPALPWQQMPDFMQALLARQEGMAALALRFAILTASRTGPVRLARWREMDLAGAVWTVPGAHMKGGKAHRAPLSPAALSVLEEARPLGGEPGDLVFPGAREGRPLSDVGLSRLVRGMACDGLPAGARPRWADHEGRAVVPHGFRTSFKGWALAAGWPDPLSELALAHADKDRVRAAYAREDMLAQRRPMMDAWAAHCGVGSSASAPTNRQATETNRQATEAGAASPLSPSEAMPSIRFVL